MTNRMRKTLILSDSCRALHSTDTFTHHKKSLINAFGHIKARAQNPDQK